MSKQFVFTVYNKEYSMDKLEQQDEDWYKKSIKEWFCPHPVTKEKELRSKRSRQVVIGYKRNITNDDTLLSLLNDCFENDDTKSCIFCDEYHELSSLKVKWKVMEHILLTINKWYSVDCTQNIRKPWLNPVSLQVIKLE